MLKQATRLYIIAAMLGIIPLIITPQGLSLQNPDSLGFMQAAHALRTEGVTSSHWSLAHWPPLQALMIMAVDNDMFALRIIYGITLAGNVLLLGVGLRMVVNRAWVMWGLLFAVGLTPYWIYYHGQLLTEPAFTLLTNLGIILIIRGNYRAAAVAIALSAMQRYIGVVMIGVGVLWIYQHAGMRRALWYGIISAAPLSLWIIRGQIIHEKPGRTFDIHLITPAHMQGATALLTWFGAGLAVFGLMILINRRMPRQWPPIARLSVFYAACYILFLFISISFFDPATVIYGRTLLPLLIPLWWALAAGLDSQLEGIRYKPLITALLVVVMGAMILHGALTAVVMMINGVV